MLTGSMMHFFNIFHTFYIVLVFILGITSFDFVVVAVVLLQMVPNQETLNCSVVNKH